MIKPIIEIENISKCYRIGATSEPYLSLRDEIGKTARRVSSAFARLLFEGQEHKSSKEIDFWALKDVSFSVKEGEAVGIIGRNGAGKSTLLKILSQITPPTTGKITMRGRVASLLEVGTGFHPELTGRENIFLNGTILGMSHREVKRKFDEIVAFAEVEKFLDTPVKRYSSGMYVRSAFAVAAHLEPEILVVDEVLAVGDAQFQKKCLGKMGEIAKGGRTVLFVSHNMVALQSLCPHAILLDKGELINFGTSDQLIKQYLGKFLTNSTERCWNSINEAPGTDNARIHKLSVKPLNISTTDLITIRTPLLFEFEYWNLKEGCILTLSHRLLNEQGIEIFNTFPIKNDEWSGKALPKGLFRSTFILPGDLLNDGRYTLQFNFIENFRHVLYKMDDALVFDVHDSPERRNNWAGKWNGAIRPDLLWDTQLIEKIETL